MMAWSEPLRRLEHQGRCIAATTRVGCYLGTEQLRTCATDLVERSGMRHGQQSQRRGRRSGLVLALGRDQRTLGPMSRVGCQLGGTFEEGGGRGQATACPSPVGRALELGGDALVEPGRSVPKVPGAAIRINVGVGGLREGAVDTLALLR